MPCTSIVQAQSATEGAGEFRVFILLYKAAELAGRCEQCWAAAAANGAAPGAVDQQLASIWQRLRLLAAGARLRSLLLPGVCSGSSALLQLSLKGKK